MSQLAPKPVMDYPSPIRPGISRPGRQWIGWMIFGGLAIILVFLLRANNSTVPYMPLSTFTKQLKSGNVREVSVQSDQIYVTLRGPIGGVGNAALSQNFRVQLAADMGNNWSFAQWLLDNANGAEVRLENNQNLVLNLLLPLVPWILIFGFIWFFVFRQLRKTNLREPLPMVVASQEAK
jgi:cell division protease FtsH